MRTLDEEIAHQREVAEKIRTEHNCECDYYDIDIDCVKCAEEHEQLAEWLEELKMLRELKEEHRKIGNIEGFNKGYNKAIDEFVEKIQWEYLNGCGIKQSEIEFLVAVSNQVAEQLKEGRKMTESEAIKQINMLNDALNWQRADADESSEALQMAIKALEKQIPIKHHHTKVFAAIDNIRLSICPNCLYGILNPQFEYPKYCVNCGQAIDWSDTDAV